MLLVSSQVLASSPNGARYLLLEQMLAWASTHLEAPPEAVKFTLTIFEITTVAINLNIQNSLRLVWATATGIVKSVEEREVSKSYVLRPPERLEDSHYHNRYFGHVDKVEPASTCSTGKAFFNFFKSVEGVKSQEELFLHELRGFWKNHI